MDDAVRAMYKAVFGGSPEGLFEITTLATAPEKQGRGYGSALVAAVHDKVNQPLLLYMPARNLSARADVHWATQADARGAATFLLTSDAKGFYEVVGYTMVAETVVGLDNPKWTGGPVALRVVSALRYLSRVVLCAYSLGFSDVKRITISEEGIHCQ